MYSMTGTLRIFMSLNVKAIDQKNHRKMYDRLKD